MENSEKKWSSDERTAFELIAKPRPQKLKEKIRGHFWITCDFSEWDDKRAQLCKALKKIGNSVSNLPFVLHFEHFQDSARDKELKELLQIKVYKLVLASVPPERVDLFTRSSKSVWQTTVKELMVYHLDKEQKGIDSEETRKLLAAFPNLEVVRISSIWKDSNNKKLSIGAGRNGNTPHMNDGTLEVSAEKNQLNFRELYLRGWCLTDYEACPLLKPNQMLKRFELKGSRFTGQLLYFILRLKNPEYIWLDDTFMNFDNCLIRSFKTASP
ncbi:hypothetical protein BCY86_06600 [Pajaroellobacter abortibovis]|uniref:Uncharacterized protein n=2 Tax=Pajaroellobacter abortibovis TaxID=1882918 RepID=A0A1L6MXR6_9BACT|nr:hypothetical protein BCY86_06600 [Pajaroellobacter abortibovis]